MRASIHALYRYPVKGLSPEPVTEAFLKVGQHFPGDRLYAIENGPSGFDPKAAAHLPKLKYLMLMRNERLARFKTRYDDETTVLTITQGGVAVTSGVLNTASGRASIEAFYAQAFSDELRGAPRILAAPPCYRFMDSTSGYLSIIDVASVAAISRAAERRNVNPLRFRANVYVEGLGEWGEFGLLGQEVQLGTARLHITKRIDRCAATDVDPDTGIRDMRMVELLERHFGHHDCGVYARVIGDGVIRNGDGFASLTL